LAIHQVWAATSVVSSGQQYVSPAARIGCMKPQMAGQSAATASRISTDESIAERHRIAPVAECDTARPSCLTSGR
jgi:hypothetical protein